METAYYYDRLIHLYTETRSDWQKWHEAGKKGLLACAVCGEAVKLYLGIKAKPHFYHASNLEACVMEASPAVKETAATAEYEEETNGFRLPKSRSISTTSSVPELSFKEPKIIKTTCDTVTLHHTDSQRADSYLHALSRGGVHLDDFQSKAVTTNDKAVLVVAGAGSGKTRVLTARTAYLIHEKEVNPASIMLVTFTSKAALEMKERLMKYPDMTKSIISRIVSGTFHSILYQILLFHEPDKWKRTNLLASNWQKELALKEIGTELGIDMKDFPFDAALQLIGAWKNSLQFPNEIKPASDWEEKVLPLYKKYEERKHIKGLYDFDDMLVGGYYFFLENPMILETYQNRFSHFLLDEFQDINKVQYEWIKLMSKKAESVYAVGDDDQAIYAFRGSDPKYLLDYEKDFTNAKVIYLQNNYRSTNEIVAAANEVIKINKNRRPKKMAATYSGGNPLLFYPYDEEEEATMIVTDIVEKIQAGAEPKDFAILFRTNTNSRAMFERLSSSSLPFRLEQDSGSFYSRFIVRSMLAYLKLAVDPDDQHAVSNLLPTLFLKKSVLQDLKALSILEDCTLADGFAKIKTGFAFQESKLKKMPAAFQKLKTASPLEAIAYVEKELGFQDFIKKRGNEGNQWDKGSDDLRDLKVVAKKFGTIGEFVAYTDHMIAMNTELKKQYQDTKNAITLTTIHRAKGLEYKTVYILGTVDGSIPHEYALEAYRNSDTQPLEEERRLLYVSMTRSMEKLYVSIPMHLRGRKAKTSRFLNAVKLADLPKDEI